jgi:hypothetical protein
MGGCSSPELVRFILDGCHWLTGIAGYPIKDAMGHIVKVVGENRGGGGGSTVPLSVHYDRVVYLPTNTDDYSGTFVTSPGDAQFRQTVLPGPAMTKKNLLHPCWKD